MTMYKELDSGWQYRVPYKKADGTHSHKSKNGFRTKKAAMVAAEKVEEALKSGLDLDTLTQSFPGYYREWVETYKLGKFSPANDKLYRTAINVVEEYFSGVSLNQITRLSYQKFINQYAEGRTKRSVKKMHHMIGASLKDAFHDGVLPLDVTYKVKIHGTKDSQRPEDKFLNEGQAEKLLSVLMGLRKPFRLNAYMAILQLALGARIGEVMALTLEDLDFEKNLITINKSWDYKFTRSFAPTKNKKTRVVSIDQGTMNLVKEAIHQRKLLALKGRWQNPNELLFADRHGEPPSVEGTNKMLKQACEAADVPVITSHSLRHTHASILLLHGAKVHYIADRLGDTPQVVEEVYAHVLEEMRDKGDRQASDIFAGLYQTNA